MDIYLKPLSNKKAKFRFPSLPDEQIKVKTKSNYQDYDIIRKGTYSFPAGPDPYTYSWDGYFWGRPRKGTGLNREWAKPLACIKRLSAWERKGTPLNLVVSGGGINVDVTIKSFEYERFGGRGDYTYSITFVQYKELRVSTVDDSGSGKKKAGKKKKKKGATRPAKPKTKKYVVVPGDTLWGISTKFYGTGSSWTKIYNANKDTIESTARSRGMAGSNNGWWIFAGTTLDIPE